MAEKNKDELLFEYRKALENINRELTLAMGDINESEKTISRLRNETYELKEKIDTIFNGCIDD